MYTLINFNGIIVSTLAHTHNPDAENKAAEFMQRQIYYLPEAD